jgi:hypothetical protein
VDDAVSPNVTEPTILIVRTAFAVTDVEPNDTVIVSDDAKAVVNVE